MSEQKQTKYAVSETRVYTFSEDGPTAAIWLDVYSSEDAALASAEKNRTERMEEILKEIDELQEEYKELKDMVITPCDANIHFGLTDNENE